MSHQTASRAAALAAFITAAAAAAHWLPDLYPDAGTIPYTAGAAVWGAIAANSAYLVVRWMWLKVAAADRTITRIFVEELEQGRRIGPPVDGDDTDLQWLLSHVNAGGPR